VGELGTEDTEQKTREEHGGRGHSGLAGEGKRREKKESWEIGLQSIEEKHQSHMRKKNDTQGGKKKRVPGGKPRERKTIGTAEQQKKIAELMASRTPKGKRVNWAKGGYGIAVEGKRFINNIFEQKYPVKEEHSGGGE